MGEAEALDQGHQDDRQVRTPPRGEEVRLGPRQVHRLSGATERELRKERHIGYCRKNSGLTPRLSMAAYLR